MTWPRLIGQSNQEGLKFCKVHWIPIGAGDTAVDPKPEARDTYGGELPPSLFEKFARPTELLRIVTEDRLGEFTHMPISAITPACETACVTLVGGYLFEVGTQLVLLAVGLGFADISCIMTAGPGVGVSEGIW